MKKYINTIVLLLTLTGYGQSAIEMKTPENANEKFAQFIAKKKFVAENYYSGVANEKMRSIFTDKINKVASDFQSVATSGNPTDKKYQEKIKIGLSRFADVYMKLDTEDRERVCSYFEELMDIVGLNNSNGQLNTFMYGFDPMEKTKEKN